MPKAKLSFFLMILITAACSYETSEDTGEELTSSAIAADGECTEKWIAIDPRPYITPALPDTNAIYWVFPFRTRSDQPLRFELEGEFPDARYVSLSLYDLETGVSVDSLRDYEIEPDSSSINPFRYDSDLGVEERTFTVTATSQAYATGEPNELLWPTPSTAEITTSHLALAYRVYLPRERGRVRPPRVTVREPHTRAPAACPPGPRELPPLAEALTNLPLFYGTGDDVRFVHLAGDGLGPNPDGGYLAAGFQGRSNQVAVFRFRAPTFPRTGAGERPSAEDDVRYWSICLNGVNTTVSSCLADENAIIDPDGYVTVVIGPDLAPVRRAARGANFLPWGLHLRPIILYRNTFPSDGFEGHFAQVPHWGDMNDDGVITQRDLDDGPDGGAAADNHLPNGYAPTGVVCSIRSFLVGSCPR